MRKLRLRENVMPKVFRILIGQEKMQAQVFLTPSKPKLPKSGRLSESTDGIPFPDVQNLKAWGLGTCIFLKIPFVNLI